MLKEKKVCIVTKEFYGFFKNGGIGTANFGIAKALASGRNSVTICIVTDPHTDTGIASKLESDFKIKVEFIEHAPEVKKSDRYSEKALSYSIHKWLEKRNFDIVISDDYKGLSYYSLMAKKCGLAHITTYFMTVVHGPMDWLLEIQEEPFNGVENAITIDMERFVIENADHTVYVSSYIKNYLALKGYMIKDHTSSVLRYPGHAYQNLILNDEIKFRDVSSIAFFGRQELRKGLLLFIDVVLKLNALGKNPDIHFLGKFSKIYQIHSSIYISELLKNIPNRIFVHSDLDSYQCIEYLKKNKCLAVIPSLSDNLPNTVDECLAQSIPFLTTSTGGQRELVSEMFHAEHILDADPICISKKIFEILTIGRHSVAKSANNYGDTVKSWVNFIENINTQASVVVKENADPLVTLCVVHYNQYFLLLQTLKGIREQTYKNIEIILVDDGSTEANALQFLDKIEKNSEYEGLKIKLLRQQNKYLGRARNYALSQATGDYILFMDDDNYAHPQQVEKLVNAITTSKSQAVSIFSYFHPLPSIPDLDSSSIIGNYPLGSGILSGKFSNNYGDSNSIFDIHFLRNAGGFFEDKGLPFEDWQCFSKIVANNGTVLVLPEPLMYYRIRKNSMLRTTPVLRALRHIINTPFINDKNEDRAYVQKYVYEKSLQDMICSATDWQKIVRENSSNNAILSRAINNEVDPNSADAIENVKKLIGVSSGNISINQDQNLSGDFKIKNNNLSFDKFKKSLNKKFHMLSQLRSKERLQDYENIINKPSFELDLSALHDQQDVYLLTNRFFPGTDWITYECRYDGIFFHTQSDRPGIAFIPNAINPNANFIRIRVVKIFDECSVGNFTAFLVPTSDPERAKNFAIDKISAFSHHRTSVKFKSTEEKSHEILIDISMYVNSKSTKINPNGLIIVCDQVDDTSYGHFLIDSIVYY